MTVTTIQTESTGFGSFQPRHGRAVSTDVYATIIEPGYLNNSPSAKGQPFSNGDLIDIVYNNGNGGMTSGVFQISISPSSAQISLVPITSQITNVQTVSTTPASGSCAVQFQLQVAGGGAATTVTPIWFYTSTNTGSITTAVSSYTALTYGAISSVVTGQVGLGTTDSSGRLGVTVTASAGTYYLTFFLPNGEKVISSAIVCN